MRRGNALIACLEFQFFRELLQFVANNRAVRQPQRQPTTDVVVDLKNPQFLAKLFVIALQRFGVCHHMLIERFLAGEGPGVNARHHLVLRVASPIRTSHVAQLESVSRNLFRVFDVGPFAHVEERTIAKERQGLQVVLGEQFLRILLLIWLLHFFKTRHRRVVLELFAGKALTVLDDAPHALFEIGKIRFGNRRGEHKVVIETVANRRAEAQRRTWSQFQHSLREDVGKPVTKLKKLVIGREFTAVFKLHDHFPSVLKRQTPETARMKGPPARVWRDGGGPWPGHL